MFLQKLNYVLHFFLLSLIIRSTKKNLIKLFYCDYLKKAIII